MRRIYEGPFPIEEKIIRPVAKLYGGVFAEWPWEERTKCAVCGNFSASSPEQRMQCTNPGCAGFFTEEAYPMDETVSYIRKEIQKPQAVALAEVKMEDVRMTLEDVLAFGWGFASDAQSFAKDKYATEEMRSLLKDLLVRAGTFFYVSEVGVKPETQGKGLGTKMTKRIVSQGQTMQETIVLRTNESSPMRTIAEKMGMKPILGLKTGLTDRENEARVIFVGGAYGKRE